MFARNPIPIIHPARLGALLSSPALDVRLMTALQVQKAVALQVLQVHCTILTDLVVEKKIRQMALCAGL